MTWYLLQEILRVISPTLKRAWALVVRPWLVCWAWVSLVGVTCGDISERPLLSEFPLYSNPIMRTLDTEMDLRTTGNGEG